jgi:hypothetical protein
VKKIVKYMKNEFPDLNSTLYAWCEYCNFEPQMHYYKDHGLLRVSEGGKEYSSHNKTKEGQLDWTHIAQELPYKTHY